MATFISLFLMDSAQPALLYIVPCTLLPVMLTACVRGEFKDMWDGDRETQLVSCRPSMIMILRIHNVNVPVPSTMLLHV